jgi:hypothetical protein
VYLSKEDHGTPRSITGTPPDWYRTPRTVDLFPALGNLLSQVSALTAQLSDTTTGYTELLKASVAALEQQIKGYTDLATRLTAASSSISAFSSIDLGTVSIRPFNGTGGTNFIKKDIIQAFGDTSDPNRPPFDADEFVAGVVVIATTPSAVALLENLLGSLSSASSVIEDALEKIDVVLDTIEDSLFNDDMSVHSATAVPASSTTDALTGPPQIGPGSYCYHSYEPNTTFDDNLNPI